MQQIVNFGIEKGKSWESIQNSYLLSQEEKSKLENKLIDEKILLFSSDADLTIFGSLARNECTRGSDIDWTLLIDGQSDPGHHELGHYINGKLKELNFILPGTTGLFGQITYSHDLINYIGGEDDTNHNLSRRIMMLLESDKIASTNKGSGYGTAYDRVVRGIINQYISHDSGFSSERGAKAKVPRFLLNDIVRFWRTMCVDFAYKQREQKGKKWALRNIKLRMSRKVLFVKGLLMCFSCYNQPIDNEELKDRLKKIVSIKPLDFIFSILKDYEINEDQIFKLFNSYNDFLSILDNVKKREELSNLEMLEAYSNNEFNDARKICDSFQEALDWIFIYNRNILSTFSLKYGVF